MQLNTEKRFINKEKMKKYIGHLIYKWIGTLDFIRQIEWRNMLDRLDPKEGERILDVAYGGRNFES